MVSASNQPPHRLVLQLVELFEEHPGDDFVAVAGLQHRVEVELNPPIRARVVLEEAVEEGEEKRLEGRDELAEGEGGEVAAGVLRREPQEPGPVDGRAGGRVHRGDDVPGAHERLERPPHGLRVLEEVVDGVEVAVRAVGDGPEVSGDGHPALRRQPSVSRRVCTRTGSVPRATLITVSAGLPSIEMAR